MHALLIPLIRLSPLIFALLYAVQHIRINPVPDTDGRRYEVLQCRRHAHPQFGDVVYLHGPKELVQVLYPYTAADGRRMYIALMYVGIDAIVLLPLRQEQIWGVVERAATVYSFEAIRNKSYDDTDTD